MFLFGIILAFCRDCTVKRRCRRRVNAVICDVDVSWTVTTISPISSLSTINTIRSTITPLDGQEYRVVSRVEYSKKDEIKVGSYEVLFVDERIPGTFPAPLRIGNGNQRPYLVCAGSCLCTFSFSGLGRGGIGFLVALGLLLLGDLCYDAWSKNRRSDCILLSKYIVLYLKYIA